MRVPLSEDYDDFTEKLYRKAVEDIDHWFKHLSMLYAEEANVKEIKPSQIIGAMKCKRVIFSKEPIYEGGIYKLVEYVANPHFKNPDEEIQKIIQENQNKMHQWQSIATFPNSMSLLSSNALEDIINKVIAKKGIGIIYNQFNIIQNVCKETKEREGNEIRRLTALETASLSVVSIEQEESKNQTSEQAQINEIKNNKARLFHTSSQKIFFTKATKPSVIGTACKRRSTL